MKRKFVALVTIIMSLIISVTALTGCNLFEKDNTRDLNQVVAEVCIKEGAPTDKIYKKDMVMAYLNYGYMYEQYYSYSTAQVFTLIINNLVQTRVYVQNAMSEFNDGVYDYAAKFTDEEKDEKASLGAWDVDKYLSTEEITDATYSTYKDLNDLLKSYELQEDAEEVKNSDALPEAVRTTPTDAKNAEKEIDKDAYIEKGIDTNSTAERRKAFNKIIKVFEANELLGDSYNGDIKTTDYYIRSLKGYKETALVKKYENFIKDEVRSAVTFGDLETAYTEKYDEQANMTNAEFVNALTSAKADSPLLVSKYGTYGYVYNLLLGASDVQSADIKAIDKNLSNTEKALARKTILEATIVKDLRATWIYSGYDFEFDATAETGVFTGDYTFAKDKANSLPFQGKLDLLNAEDKDEEDYVASYKIKETTEFGLANFVEFMEGYVYGASQADVNNGNANVYKAVQYNGAVSEYDAKINELLFAFSTDSGSLNTFKGYGIKPAPDGANKEEYVTEFATMGRELLEMGGNSYVMVATDYGYHVLFFSEKFTVDYGFDSLTKYLDSEYGAKDWQAEFAKMIADFDEYEETDTYLYMLFNSLTANKVNAALTKNQNSLLDKYLHNEATKGVTLYKDTYKDLVG